MSYTEICKFTEKGKFAVIGETKNGSRGALNVWFHLETKYLPSLPEPVNNYIGSGTIKSYYSRFIWGKDTNEREKMQDIWDLILDSRLSNEEKITLCSTFDKVVIKKENLEKLCNAYYTFSKEFPNTSLGEQADIIKKELESRRSISYICFNQTSVNENLWKNYLNCLMN